MFKLSPDWTPYTLSHARPIIVDVIASDVQVDADQWSADKMDVLKGADAAGLCAEIRQAHYPAFGGYDPRNS